MGKKILAVVVGVLVVFTFTAMCGAEEKESAKEEQIKHAQEDLATLGFYNGEATGKINKETREAVKEFQKKDMDMKVPNGILNDKTCAALKKKAEKKLKKEEAPAKYGPVEGTEKMQEGMGKVKEGMDIGK